MAVRLDDRMQVEAHREAVAALGRQALAVRRHEQVLAVEPPAVGGEPQRALVHDAEALRIAVVRQRAAITPLSRSWRDDLHVGRPGEDRRAEQRLAATRR